MHEPPAWVDFERIDAGAVAWWRAGAFQQLLALTAGSLAYGYGSASLARPLARTGRLTRMALRRLGETARWVQLATRPGALHPGGAGVRATVRLRLVHALVRRNLRAQPDWDLRNWGEPLSAADTVATGIAGFFVVPMRALEDLGVHYSRRERESILALWSWVCLLMGAPEDQIPHGSFGEAREWATAATALDSGGIEESADLLRALLFHGLAWDRSLPGPAATVARFATGQALAACSRRWLGTWSGRAG